MNSNARYVARALYRILRQPFAGWPNQSFPIAKKEWMQQASWRFWMLNFPDQSNMESPQIWWFLLFFSNLKAAHFFQMPNFPQQKSSSSRSCDVSTKHLVNLAEVGWCFWNWRVEAFQKGQIHQPLGVRFFSLTYWIDERSEISENVGKNWQQHCTAIIWVWCLFAAFWYHVHLSTADVCCSTFPFPSLFWNGSSSCPWSFWITHKVHIRCSESW